MRLIVRYISFILAILLLIQCEKEEPKVNITDNNFLNALIELGIDTDGDGQISNAEAEVVISLDVSGYSISDMTGIEKFVNLDTLDCSFNQLTSLDVSSNTALKYLDCYWNQLTSLDLSNNIALETLYCQSNQLTSLDVSNNTALIILGACSNQLINLDVTNNTALEWLICWGNQLTSLDVSNNIALLWLICDENQLTSLDLSNNTALEWLYCSSNWNLSSLNVTNNSALIWLWCGGTKLTTLDISNNTSLGVGEVYGTPNCHLDIRQMPYLEKVCVWTMPFPPEGLMLCTEGSPNVYFTTECSE